MYDAIDDPYCYPGTTVLLNRRNLRAQRALTRFELAMSAQRADEPLPIGRLSVSHYRAVHRHLFQDVYSWSGRFRSVRMSKQGSMFAYPEHIDREMKRLFSQLRQDNYLRGLSANAFAEKAASFLTTLNAIHPFRDGNGRTQLAFMVLVANSAGHPLDLNRMQPGKLLQAMVRGFHGDESLLRQQIARLIPS